MIVCHGLLSLSCIPKGSCRTIAKRHAWACSTSGPSGISAMSASSHVKQISPDKDVNFHCTTAAFTVSTESLGFVVLCQLTHRLGLNMLFLFVGSQFCRMLRLKGPYCWLQTISHGFALAFRLILLLIFFNISRVHRGVGFFISETSPL